MPKKKPEEAKSGGGWLATYADFMSVLLCFFVLLFSMSVIDAQKFQQISESFQQAAITIFDGGATAIGDGTLISNGVSQLNELDMYINSLGKSDSEDDDDDVTDFMEQLEQQQLEASEELAERLSDALGDDALGNEISVDFNAQYVTLTLNGALLFDSGQATLRPEASEVLDRVGHALLLFAEGMIEIEGHTDNVPLSGSRHRYQNNNELSSFRAFAVFEYLVEGNMIDERRVKCSGRGEFQPIADNSTPEGRAQNRRVEIKVYHALSSQGVE